MGRPLTAVFVKSVAKPGKCGDRHGLILQVRPTGSTYWFWRGTVRGKRVGYGIGSYPYITLAEARQTAFEDRGQSETGGRSQGAERRADLGGGLREGSRDPPRDVEAGKPHRGAMAAGS